MGDSGVITTAWRSLTDQVSAPPRALSLNQTESCVESPQEEKNRTEGYRGPAHVEAGMGAEAGRTGAPGTGRIQTPPPPRRVVDDNDVGTFSRVWGIYFYFSWLQAVANVDKPGA